MWARKRARKPHHYDAGGAPPLCRSHHQHHTLARLNSTAAVLILSNLPGNRALREHYEANSRLCRRGHLLRVLGGWANWRQSQ